MSGQAATSWPKPSRSSSGDADEHAVTRCRRSRTGLRKNRLGGYGVLKKSPPQWLWLCSDTGAFTAVHTLVFGGGQTIR